MCLQLYLSVLWFADRVIRIRGEASPLLPWPASNADSDQNGKETGGEGASVHNSANGHAGNCVSRKIERNSGYFYVARIDILIE